MSKNKNRSIVNHDLPSPVVIKPESLAYKYLLQNIKRPDTKQPVEYEYHISSGMVSMRWTDGLMHKHVESTILDKKHRKMMRLYLRYESPALYVLKKTVKSDLEKYFAADFADIVLDPAGSLIVSATAFVGVNQKVNFRFPVSFDASENSTVPTIETALLKALTESRYSPAQYCSDSEVVPYIRKIGINDRTLSLQVELPFGSTPFRYHIEKIMKPEAAFILMSEDGITVPKVRLDGVTLSDIVCDEDALCRVRALLRTCELPIVRFSERIPDNVKPIVKKWLSFADKTEISVKTNRTFPFITIVDDCQRVSVGPVGMFRFVSDDGSISFEYKKKDCPLHDDFVDGVIRTACELLKVGDVRLTKCTKPKEEGMVVSVRPFRTNALKTQCAIAGIEFPDYKDYTFSVPPLQFNAEHNATNAKLFLTALNAGVNAVVSDIKEIVASVNRQAQDAVLLCKHLYDNFPFDCQRAVMQEIKKNNGLTISKIKAFVKSATQTTMSKEDIADIVYDLYEKDFLVSKSYSGMYGRYDMYFLHPGYERVDFSGANAPIAPKEEVLSDMSRQNIVGDRWMRGFLKCVKENDLTDTQLVDGFSVAVKSPYLKKQYVWDLVHFLDNMSDAVRTIADERCKRDEIFGKGYRSIKAAKKKAEATENISNVEVGKT